MTDASLSSYEGLIKKVNAAALSDGEGITRILLESTKILSAWFSHLKNYETTGNSDELLEGFRASILETVACGALGLVRPAVIAIRGQIDVILAWLYFKDHPIEWEKLQKHGEGYMLKRDAIDYLKAYFENFDKTFLILSGARQRKEPDPYKMLSAHVHLQAPLVLPKMDNLENVVGSSKQLQELPVVQFEAAEYISDILIACYSKSWASLPDEIVDNIRMRLGNEKFGKLIS